MKRWCYFDNDRLDQLLRRAHKLGTHVIWTRAGWRIALDRSPRHRTPYSLWKELTQW